MMYMNSQSTPPTPAQSRWGHWLHALVPLFEPTRLFSWLARGTFFACPRPDLLLGDVQDAFQGQLLEVEAVALVKVSADRLGVVVDHHRLFAHLPQRSDTGHGAPVELHAAAWWGKEGKQRPAWLAQESKRNLFQWVWLQFYIYIKVPCRLQIESISNLYLHYYIIPFIAMKRLQLAYSVYFRQQYLRLYVTKKEAELFLWHYYIQITLKNRHCFQVKCLLPVAWLTDMIWSTTQDHDPLVIKVQVVFLVIGSMDIVIVAKLFFAAKKHKFKIFWCLFFLWQDLHEDFFSLIGEQRSLTWPW